MSDEEDIQVSKVMMVLSPHHGRHLISFGWRWWKRQTYDLEPVHITEKDGLTQQVDRDITDGKTTGDARCKVDGDYTLVLALSGGTRTGTVGEVELDWDVGREGRKVGPG